jgi:hypothetical protein
MSFSNALPILEQIQSDITAPITALMPTVKISLDEAVDFVYEDLPCIAIYPTKETFDLSESAGSQSYKHLFISIELRMQGASATTIATPVVNAISAAIQADQFLGGQAVYVELQDIAWASERTNSGTLCGARLDIQVDYYTT